MTRDGIAILAYAPRKVRYTYRINSLLSEKKNTLVTFRHEDRIYFGIARCYGDKFTKEEGQFYAEQRAAAVIENPNRCAEYTITVPAYPHSCTYKKLFLLNSQFGGYCSVDAVDALLDHFHGLDDKMEKQYTQRKLENKERRKVKRAAKREARLAAQQVQT